MLVTMESKTAAYHKLEALIERGRATASDVVDYVMNNQPNDRLAQAGASMKVIKMEITNRTTVSYMSHLRWDFIHGVFNALMVTLTRSNHRNSSSGG